MNPYHRFLIKHRIYCESRECLDKLTHATTVVNFNGYDMVLCDTHAQRLKAARKSEKVFEEQEANARTHRPRLR